MIQRQVHFPESEQRVIDLYLTWDWIEGDVALATKLKDGNERTTERFAMYAGLTPEEYRAWSLEPNPYFEGLTPREVVEHEEHDYDSLWEYFTDLGADYEMEESYLHH